MNLNFNSQIHKVRIQIIVITAAKQAYKEIYNGISHCQRPKVPVKKITLGFSKNKLTLRTNSPLARNYFHYPCSNFHITLLNKDFEIFVCDCINNQY